MRNRGDAYLSELNFIRIPFQVVQDIDGIVINLLIPDFQNTIIALLKSKFNNLS